MKDNVKEQLISYIDALYPIIYINHFDFKLIDDMIKSISDGKKIVEFHNGLGIVDFTDKSSLKECDLSDFLKSVKEEGFRDNLFLVLKDIHSQLNNPEIISLIKYIAYRNLYDENYNASIFIISSTLCIPEELADFITVFNVPLPEISEIRKIISKFIRDLDIDVSADVIEQGAWSFQGLDEFQIKQILNLFYQDGGSLNFDDKHLIFRQKELFMKKTGLLKMITDPPSFDDIGGLENLKEWLYQKKYIFNQLDKAMEFGLHAPAVMITGMPKCGKTLAAKATASLFEVPLLKLDVRRLLGKYISESEENMRRALNLAQAMSPCVLWIDEIENVFFETEVHLFNQFLTWMQEKENLVFVVATANDISKIPSELLEKRCFDELFYVDFPNSEEREKIIQIYLQKRNKWCRDLDILSLVELTDEYSSADLEAVVKKAIENCFLEGKENLTTEDLINAQKSIKPISGILQTKIQENKEAVKNIDLQTANSIENKVAVKPWIAAKENENEFVDCMAVTLYEVLGKNWWKKHRTKFAGNMKQIDFHIESGFWGYGIELI